MASGGRRDRGSRLLRDAYRRIAVGDSRGALASPAGPRPADPSEDSAVRWAGPRGRDTAASTSPSRHRPSQPPRRDGRSSRARCEDARPDTHRNRSGSSNRVEDKGIVRRRPSSSRGSTRKRVVPSTPKRHLARFCNLVWGRSQWRADARKFRGWGLGPGEEQGGLQASVKAGRWRGSRTRNGSHRRRGTSPRWTLRRLRESAYRSIGRGFDHGYREFLHGRRP